MTTRLWPTRWWFVLVMAALWAGCDDEESGNGSPRDADEAGGDAAGDAAQDPDSVVTDTPEDVLDDTGGLDTIEDGGGEDTLREDTSPDTTGQDTVGQDTIGEDTAGEDTIEEDTSEDDLTALSDDFDGSELAAGWTVLNPDSAGVAVEGGALHLEPNANSVWFQAATSVMVYREVTGNFSVTSAVTTRSVSEPDEPPSTPFRLGGLSARNPDRSDGENYVFIVIGADFNDLSVEHKTTVDSESTYEGPPWPGGEGELRICRVGDEFRLFVREAEGAWQLEATYTRDDFPETIQVGAVAYNNTTPADLRASFDWIDFARVEALGDCDD